MSPSNSYYEAEIKSMDPGLSRAALRVLSYHVGKENTISRLDMVQDLKALGFGALLQPITFDRHMRQAIADLRKEGHLVCSSSGDGGYYLAKDRQEYDDFSETEYRSKIIDMSITLQAMDQSAKQRFGSDTPAEQPRLI